MIEFRALGTLHLVETRGRDLSRVVAQPKLTALLVYLTLARPRGFHRRDTLLALLWPELDEKRARHALNQAFYSIRRVLGDGLVVRRGTEEVGVDPERLRCDVLAFEQSLQGDRFEDALRHYGGELLPGFHAGTSAEFEQWLDGERARHRRLAVEAAVKLAEEREAADDVRGALRWARWAHETAPDDEAVLRRVLELSDRSGDRVGAIATYDAFAARIKEQYDAEPATDTQELMAAIRQRAVPDREADARPPATIAGRDVAPGPPLAGNPPPPSRSRWYLGVGAVGIVVVLGALFAARDGEPTPADGPPVEPARLVLAEFVNHTSDSLLGAVVTEALRIDLGQSRKTRLVEPVDARAALARMEHDSIAPLDITLAREVAVREGAKAVVAGEVYAAGLGYVLAAKLVAAERESTLVSLRQTAADSTELIGAIDRLSADLRERIGEPLEAIRASPPLEQATTASLPALRAFTEAARVGWIDGSVRSGRPSGVLCRVRTGGFGCGVAGVDLPAPRRALRGAGRARQGAESLQSVRGPVEGGGPRASTSGARGRSADPAVASRARPGVTMIS